MYGKNAHSAYQTVQVTTTDRGRLLLMMYEGGIKFLRQAKVGLEQRDIPKFAKYLSKGQAIIAELMNTLDFEQGGSIAKDLDRLYDFMLFYLTEANLEKNPQKVQRVIELLETIYSAYKEIIEGERAEAYSAGEQAAEAAQPIQNEKAAYGQLENTLRRVQISL
jgi:flagellar protein FliS